MVAGDDSVELHELIGAFEWAMHCPVERVVAQEVEDLVSVVHVHMQAQGKRTKDLLAELKPSKSGCFRIDKIHSWFDSLIQKSVAMQPAAQCQLVSAVAVLQHLNGHLKQKMSTVQALFRELDRDRSGSLDISEFEVAMAKIGVPLLPSEAAVVFRHIDTDNSGLISYTELVCSLQQARSMHRDGIKPPRPTSSNAKTSPPHIQIPSARGLITVPSRHCCLSPLYPLTTVPSHHCYLWLLSLDAVYHHCCPFHYPTAIPLSDAYHLYLLL